MGNNRLRYDVIVVGGGHAGCEAAAADANLGSSVLLITLNLSGMAQMSCNPSIGGIAKGQIVREIDALGGITGLVADKTTMQFKMLNRSKGPAMWSPRAQNDRMLFSWEWKIRLERIKNVFFWQDSVVDIIVKKNKAAGVITALGIIFYAKAVIFANGTFLNGIIHIGLKKFQGGRLGEKSCLELTENLQKRGFVSNRMKTGTPVRVDGRTLDFTEMEEQPGDSVPGKFSFRTESTPVKNQKSCWLTYTNHTVHEILKTGFKDSPLFSGRITGRGPRYCPSIEDKIERFSSKERHQLFIEPEGWNTIEYYVNGFSSSLSEDIQFSALRHVPGFKNARFFRPGYAIEYDYFPPSQLNYTLETKIIENIFFAGQINGTTGYEEAACQGLIAGINAHLKIKEEKEIILKRSEAYIGVLIDDLITKGTEEPYRMFTSRAEHRILLRQDNADLRLTPTGYELGLIPDEHMKLFLEKKKRIEDLIVFLSSESAEPEDINELLKKRKTQTISQRIRLSSLLTRPQIKIQDLIGELDSIKKQIKKIGIEETEEIDEAEIMLKYEAYIDKEKEIVLKMKKLEDVKLETNINYHSITALSLEAREKLSKIKPTTIGQASRISGVSPADISILIVLLQK